MPLAFQMYMCILLSAFPVRYFDESSVKSLGHLYSRKIWSTGETSESENLTKHIGKQGQVLFLAFVRNQRKWEHFLVPFM